MRRWKSLSLRSKERGSLRKISFPKLKVPKLKVKFSGRKKKAPVSGASGKKYANPIFDEWKKSVVEELAGRQAASYVVRRCAVCLLAVCVVAASSFATGYYRHRAEDRINQVISRGNGVLNEYGNMIRNLETYEKYAGMKIPVYVQFAAMLASTKLGFFIDSLSFEQISDIGSLREQFVVETGRGIDSVKIGAVWKMKGVLPREADNRWVISLKDTIESMFSVFGSKSYVSASLKGTDVEATVICYE